jgi:fatty acid kinase
MSSAREEALADPTFWEGLAHGALLGARGNSGVILAQLLRGLGEGIAGGDLAAALKVAARAARSAVSRPVEGTILTVADAAAVAATGEDHASIAISAARAAAEALARTPEQLPALAAAGVVDAGGRGLVVILEALAGELSGEEIESQPPQLAELLARPAVASAEEPVGFGYEVQYLLDADEAAVEVLGSTLDALGDSLVIVGGPRTWRVHVHVADVGGAIEAGVRAGRPYQIGVTDLSVQVAGRRCLDPDARGVVVVANGDGLAALFEGEGSITVPANPSTGEVLAVIRRAAAGRVVVLPNDPDTQAVAVAAAAEAYHEGVKVRVVPTKSPVQALAALAVRDPARRFEDDVIAMAEAASACRFAEVTTASREALTMAGHCRPGDVIALVGGEVHLIGDELVGVCTDLVDRLLGGGGELVTLLLGAGAPADLADDVRGHLARAWPFVEVQCYEAGQPHYPLIVGVE